MSASLIAVAAFAAALLILTFLSRDISLRIQEITFYVSNSQEMAVVGLFLVFMPGIFIHEGSHWAMARLTGLRTGRFRVWPVRQGNMIGMGQVAVEQKDVWRDSLVGMAPLLIGSVIVTLIGRHIFQTTTIVGALNQGDGTALLTGFAQAMQAPDATLWAYLLFVVANAMMPSASDRAPLKPVILYVVLAATIYMVLGLPLDPLANALIRLQPALHDYLGALIFVIILDMLILSVLYVLTLLLGRRFR